MLAKMKKLLALKVEATRKRGVTLIEAVLFIVIALALIVGGIVFFNQASLAQRTTDSIRSVVGIQSETRGIFQSSASFGNPGDNLVPTLIAAGAVPTNAITADGLDLQSPWGGNIDVLAAGATGETFMLLLEGVPSTACARMISFNASGSGIAGTSIKDVSTQSAAVGGATITAVAADATSLSPDAAAVACGNGGDVNILWEFNR